MLCYIPALHTHSTTMKSLGTSIVILWDTIKLKPVSTGVLSDSKDDQSGSRQPKIILMDILRLKAKIKPLGWEATINTLEVSVHARIGMLSLSVYNVMPGPGLPRLRVHRSPLVTNSGPSAPPLPGPGSQLSSTSHHTPISHLISHDTLTSKWSQCTRDKCLDTALLLLLKNKWTEWKDTNMFTVTIVWIKFSSSCSQINEQSTQCLDKVFLLMLTS